MNQITIIELQGVDDSEDYLINVPFANPNKHKRLKNPDDWWGTLVKLLRNKNWEALNLNEKGNMKKLLKLESYIAIWTLYVIQQEQRSLVDKSSLQAS